MIDNLNRRDFLALAAALSAAGAFTMTVAAQDKHAGHMMPTP
ncbi:twin-arginine translocation signal domain-containing protein [Xanthomonas translucens]